MHTVLLCYGTGMAYFTTLEYKGVHIYFIFQINTGLSIQVPKLLESPILSLGVFQLFYQITNYSVQGIVIFPSSHEERGGLCLLMTLLLSLPHATAKKGRFAIFYVVQIIVVMTLLQTY